MKYVFSKILVFLSLWIIFSSVSETLFYPVEITYEYPVYFLLYGLYGYGMFTLLQYFKVTNFAAFFIAACVFGFLAEGALIGILYEALLFSLIWTSISWHALITVVLFFYFFRKKLLWGNFKEMIIYNSLLWAFLWLWGSHSWSASEDALGEVLFNWVAPELYIKQFVFGYLLFILWHLLYDYAAKYVGNNIWNKEFYSIWGLIVITFLIWNGFLYFPISLLLPILIWGCITLLRKTKNDEVLYIKSIEKNITITRYLFTLCIPVFASMVYILFYSYDIALEMNAIYFVFGGIISLYILGKSAYILIYNR